MRHYVTFGQVHVHQIGSQFFDKDCIAVFEADEYLSAREKAFQLFGSEFCMCYSEEKFKAFVSKSLHLFPRGLVNLDCPSQGVSDER